MERTLVLPPSLGTDPDPHLGTEIGWSSLCLPSVAPSDPPSPPPQWRLAGLPQPGEEQILEGFSGKLLQDWSSLVHTRGFTSVEVAVVLLNNEALRAFPHLEMY